MGLESDPGSMIECGLSIPAGVSELVLGHGVSTHELAADPRASRVTLAAPGRATAPDDFASGRDLLLHRHVKDPQSGWPMAREITSAEGASFPALLRSRRQRSGQTQAQLAELSGLGVRTIRNWEQGWTLHPHRDSVRRLAEGLGLTGEARATFEQIAAGTHLLQSAAAEPRVSWTGEEPVSSTRTASRRPSARRSCGRRSPTTRAATPLYLGSDPAGRC
jgi:transcriptional regulator with XRE-family HTH domain